MLYAKTTVVGRHLAAAKLFRPGLIKQHQRGSTTDNNGVTLYLAGMEQHPQTATHVSLSAVPLCIASPASTVSPRPRTKKLGK